MYKVSVIIPVYKAEPYLRDCLDSVVNQTLKEIEIICVDDGSPDNSAAIVAEYQQRYDNIKLIRQENGGPSKARNAGLDAAAGEYICFLDSDDALEARAVERLYGAAVEENLDILYFNAHTRFETEALRAARESEAAYFHRPGDYSGLCTGQTMFARMFREKNFLASVCVQLFRREFLERQNLRFYPGILHEDNLFTFQCAMTARRVNYISDELYIRRVREGSITTCAKTIRHVEGCLVGYYEMLMLLQQIPLQEDTAESVSEYLYHAPFRGACNVWLQLSPEERQKPLRCGIPAVEQLLYSVKEETKKRDALQQNNMRLKRQLDAEQARSGRLAEQNRKLMAQRENSFAYCRAKYGTIYALRQLVWRFRAAWKARRQARQARSVRRLMETGGKAPLVSVVVPVYNAEKFLPECLESLLKQTMKHIEIICVDDGSTDNSLEILRGYAQKDSRVQVYTQKNQFAGAARNYGLSKARGEYVCFLDADDFFAGNLAEEAYYAAKTTQADMVIYGAGQFDNEKQEFQNAPWLLKKENLPAKRVFNHHDCPDTLFQITTPCPWTKLFRRQFVLDTGLQFPALRNSEDVVFTYCALAMAERIVTVDKALVTYRVGLSTSLEAGKAKAPLCFYEAHRMVQQKLKELGLMDRLRKSFANAALSNCVYNINLLKDPQTKRLLETELGTHGFRELELDIHSRDYYYQKTHYDEMQRLLAEFSGSCNNDNRS